MQQLSKGNAQSLYLVQKAIDKKDVITKISQSHLLLLAKWLKFPLGFLLLKCPHLLPMCWSCIHWFARQINTRKRPVSSLLGPINIFFFPKNLFNLCPSDHIDQRPLINLLTLVLSVLVAAAAAVIVVIFVAKLHQLLRRGQLWLGHGLIRTIGFSRRFFHWRELVWKSRHRKRNGGFYLSRVVILGFLLVGCKGLA